MRRNKYNNNRVICDGHVFDSEKERDRYIVLRQKQRKGEISSLQLQKEFVLTETIYVDAFGRVVGKKTKGRKLYAKRSKYICDFFYYNSYGDPVAEDVKGYKTDLYQLKKKVIADKYGILIKEI
jgi:hypothetical protein